MPRLRRPGALAFSYAVAYRLLGPDGAPTAAGRQLAQQLAAAASGGGEAERVVLPVLLACSEEDAITDFSQGALQGRVVRYLAHVCGRSASVDLPLLLFRVAPPLHTALGVPLSICPSTHPRPLLPCFFTLLQWTASPPARWTSPRFGRPPPALLVAPPLLLRLPPLRLTLNAAPLTWCQRQSGQMLTYLAPPAGCG
jgi:hypothetical protein